MSNRTNLKLISIKLL